MAPRLPRGLALVDRRDVGAAHDGRAYRGHALRRYGKPQVHVPHSLAVVSRVGTWPRLSEDDMRDTVESLNRHDVVDNYGGAVVDVDNWWLAHAPILRTVRR